MNENSIEVHNLTKGYGNLVAVDSLNFTVKKGKTFGFLGPNGAGKSTVIKILVGLIRPDSGKVLIAGHDPINESLIVRRSVGYVAERTGFYDRMTAVETLDYIGQLLDIPTNKRQKRIVELLSWVGLADRKDSYVGTYSKGMKQRLSMAQSLLAEPEILIFDEPTIGLDPIGAREQRDLILQLKKDSDVTIFMSSHILSDVEVICDDVGIISHGKLLVQDSVENLRRITGNGMNLEIVLAQPDEKVVSALRKIRFIQNIKSEGQQLMICTSIKDEVRPQIVETIVKNGGQILSFGKKETSLEEILIKIVEEEK